MSELLSYLSSLRVPDLVLCAIAVVILDLFALAVILAASREAKLCKQRWQRVSADMELRLADETFSLEADEILLGRHISADIRLMDSSVSRYHAVMTVSGGVWTITDLGSKHGTFVNEHRVKQAWLQPGDVIRLGKMQLYFAYPRPAQGTQRKGGKHRA